MTRQGHLITGAGLAIISFSLGFPLLSLGIMLGTTAPDTLEISVYNFDTKQSRRLITHRTITHWLYPWVALLIVSCTVSILVSPALWALTGFAVGGLLHLAMDIHSPMGIPITSWRAKDRVSLNQYSTGKRSELIFVAKFMAVCLSLSALF